MSSAEVVGLLAVTDFTVAALIAVTGLPSSFHFSEQVQVLAALPLVVQSSVMAVCWQQR